MSSVGIAIPTLAMQLKTRMSFWSRVFEDSRDSKKCCMGCRLSSDVTDSSRRSRFLGLEVPPGRR